MISTNQQTNFLRCSGKKQAVMYCLNDQCAQQVLFTCGDSNCKCHEEHEQCSSRGMIKFTLKKIKQKINQVDNLKTEIETIFDTTIDEISNFREKVLEDVENQLRMMNLISIQKVFLNLFQGKQEKQKLTGPKLTKLWQVVKSKNQNQNSELNEIISQINGFSKILSEKINQFSKNVDNFLKQKVKEAQKPQQRYENQLLRIVEKLKNKKSHQNQLEDQIISLRNTVNIEKFTEDDAAKITDFVLSKVRKVFDQINQSGSKIYNINLNLNDKKKSKNYFIALYQIGKEISVQKQFETMDKILKKYEMDVEQCQKNDKVQFKNKMLQTIDSYKPKISCESMKKIIKQLMEFMKENELEIINAFSNAFVNLQDESNQSLDLSLIEYSLNQVCKISKQRIINTFQLVLYLQLYNFENLNDKSLGQLKKQSDDLTDTISKLSDKISQRISQLQEEGQQDKDHVIRHNYN